MSISITAINRQITTLRKSLDLVQSRIDNGTFTYADIQRRSQLRREIHDLEFRAKKVGGK